MTLQNWKTFAKAFQAGTKDLAKNREKLTLATLNNRSSAPISFLDIFLTLFVDESNHFLAERVFPHFSFQHGQEIV